MATGNALMIRWMCGACALVFTTPLIGQQTSTADHSAEPIPIRPAGWVQDHDFPSAAKKKGNHGAVRFLLAIDESGRVYRCDIIKTSGFTLLDQQTCALMQKKARFKPAMDQSGALVASEWSRMVAWGQNENTDPMANYDLVIKVSKLPKNKQFSDLALRKVVSADGQRETCVIQMSSKIIDLDRQACDLVDQAMPSRPLKSADGAPVRGVRVQRVGFIAEGK
jgi:TonB family protein